MLMHYPDGETQAGPHFQQQCMTRVDIQMPLLCILAAQKQDQVIKQVAYALQSSSRPTTINWWKPPFRRYSQLWAHLLLKDGIVWRHHTPGPTSDTATVPVLPVTLQKDVLQQCHDSPQAGHLGAQKTLYQLRRDILDQHGTRCGVSL